MPRDKTKTILGLSVEKWINMIVGAVVTTGGGFGGFQLAKDAQAQTIAAQSQQIVQHEQKIGTLEKNVEKIQQDIATIKEGQAASNADHEVNMYYIRQSLEELKRQR